MFFATRYAFKSIQRRYKKNIAGVLAIALGVTIFVGASTGSNGLEQALASSWWSYIGDTDVAVVDSSFDYFEERLGDILEETRQPAMQGLIVAAPVIQYQNMPIYAMGQFDKNTLLTGINPSDVGFRDFVDSKGDTLDIERLLDFDDQDLSTPGDAIIGRYMAKVMDLKVGAVFQTAFPNGNGSSIAVSLYVRAIFDDRSGRGQEDIFDIQPSVYVNLEEVQLALVPEMQNRINLLKLVFNGVNRNLNDLDIENQKFGGREILELALPVVASLADDFIDTPFVYSERIFAADDIVLAVDSIRSMLNIFVFLLNATALLLIVNVQSMGMEDRKYQTAVLRSMGTSRGTVMRIFLIEATAVGTTGSLLGLLPGLLYGNYILDNLNSIFGLSDTSAQISQATIATAFILGVLLAVVTAVLPAYKSSRKSISEELRGLQSQPEQKDGKKTVIVGILLTLSGLLYARNTGNPFERSSWYSLDDHSTFLLAFALTVAGLGMILSLYISRTKALNIAGLAIWGSALFDMFVAIEWVEGEQSGENWFTVLLLFLVVGSSILTINNFETIMKGMNKTLFKFSKMRAISQVTTTSLIGKKSRGTLIFTIFTIILILNVFLTSAAYTIQTELVDQYEWRTYGNDIVVNTEVASPQIQASIEQIEGIQQVYAFRSVYKPIYSMDPTAVEFNLQLHQEYQLFVEVSETVINPNGKWDSSSFPISFLDVSNNYADTLLGYSTDEHKALSVKVLNDFFANTPYYLSGYPAAQVLGGFWDFAGTDFLTQNADGEVLPYYRAASSVSFTGDWDIFGGSILITPELASTFAEFDDIPGPNLFIVRSSNGYFDRESNLILAQAIESALNDLDNPVSLSSQMGVLVGGSTRLIEEEIRAFWNQEASVWIFLASFATFGLIIGGAGMAIVAVRSVAERTREIGMMRAIGFSRQSIIATVLLEMLTLATIGLLSGLLNGILLMQMFATKFMDITAVYPLQQLSIFGGLIIGIALVAAIIPSVRAARVSPSQALRYTG